MPQTSRRSPENLIGMQILRPSPRLPESIINYVLTSPGVILMCIQVCDSFEQREEGLCSWADVSSNQFFLLTGCVILDIYIIYERLSFLTYDT